MSAVIEELSLTNFQSYRQARLRLHSGLNLIRGRNSTGKTTLLDGLVFALFGEAPDVKPRLLISRLPGSKSMEAAVKFKSPRNGQTVEITRRGRLDSRGAYKTDERLLRINGKETCIESDEDLRTRVTELLGVSLRKFLNLVYVRQGRLTSILEPQKDQMDSVMGITLLRELREQTDEARRRLERYENRDVSTESRTLKERIIPQLERDQILLNSDVESLKLEVERLEETVKKGESTELIILLEKIEDRELTREKVRELEAKIGELLRSSRTSSRAELILRIRDLRFNLEELRGARILLASRTDASLDAWLRVKSRADALKAEIKEHESLLLTNASRCPRCGQTLEAKTLREILEKDRVKLQHLAESEEEARKEYDAGRRELDRLNGEFSAAESELKTQERFLKELEEYLSDTEQLHSRMAEINLGIGEMLEKLNLRLQPEDPDLRVKLAQQLPTGPEELASRRRELSSKLKTLNEKSEHLKRICAELRGSRELLSRLEERIVKADLARRLSEAFDREVEARRTEFLSRIEFRALQYYRSMTDQHVYSRIRVDPADYTVSVQPRGLTEMIPATRVGGGHQTLLALAMRLTLLDAVGFRSLLILDEPTYGVDSENLPQLASYIGQASRQLSQMILVTHHSICEEEASNIIEVSVRADGASTAEIKR
ncbi:AAA family ATPase [Candidatus Bathyarchaeota archaeon]|nr:AAA family ATPase [Candidatus Bathyarchaeota archaeon]